MWTFEFANSIANTTFKLNCLTHQSIYIKFQPQSCDCALYLFVPLIVVCRLEVEPEPEGTPFVEDTEPEPRQQGKQPPPFLIMPIKSQFPLILLCMNRMLPCIVSYRIVEPQSFAWPIILSTVVSKP